MTKGFELAVPVAFLVFNRPEPTARVFQAIRRARPSMLLVVADGARPSRVGEADRCRQVREIATAVDWPCTVLTRFAESNRGCGRSLSSGITWVFEQVESAIILEDDCIPDASFFPYCQELLERYREDERIFTILGHNYLFGHRRTQDSYYFSRYCQVWGWATWRRAWKHYDYDMKRWPEFRDGGWLSDLFPDRKAAAYWRSTLDWAYNRGIDTWDYQWFFTVWANSGLSIMPNVNLISNIGFDVNATHTVGFSDYDSLPTETMELPLRHPAFIVRDAHSDDRVQRTLYSPPDIWLRIRRRITRSWREWRSGRR